VNRIKGRKILHMLFKAINQRNYYVYHTSNSYELLKLQHTETKVTIQQNKLYKISRKA